MISCQRYSYSLELFTHDLLSALFVLSCAVTRTLSFPALPVLSLSRRYPCSLFPGVTRELLRSYPCSLFPGVTRELLSSLQGAFSSSVTIGLLGIEYLFG
jgi:hypothetical protein